MPAFTVTASAEPGTDSPPQVPVTFQAPVTLAVLAAAFADGEAASKTRRESRGAARSASRGENVDLFIFVLQ